MKTIFLRVALVTAALAPASAMGQSILNSSHNLSTGAGSGTTEVCVYCHTPHGADISAPAPLWNRSLALPDGGYQRYSSLQTSTLDGQEAEVGSVSLACLSCHDGTQARDTVINMPGSNNPPGGNIGTLGPITNGLVNPLALIGTDLRDDHPISIQYAGGACQGVAIGTDCDPQAIVAADPTAGDPDFEVLKSANINGQPQWWVDTTGFDLTSTGTGGAETGAPNIREKTDMLLYARTFTIQVDDGQGGTVPQDEIGPSVECGSCHDPHEATERPVQFLRISNANSDVCLACHVK